MAASDHHRRDISDNQFRDHNFINQGDIQGNIYYGLPHSLAPAEAAEVVRVIPYPRNEDLVHRQDLIEKLDKLLPRTPPGFFSAALWGLGGSGYIFTSASASTSTLTFTEAGTLACESTKVLTSQVKTQIALDYAYRRCDNDDECCIFWVHADSEATFTSDYKTIGKKLAVDDRLDGFDLLEAVRSKIETRSRWVMVLDNADDLELFGVGRAQPRNNKDLHEYIPHASQGIILWTSRDAHIAGTLVGSRRGIEVQSMSTNEAATLLARVRDKESTLKEEGVNVLLEELQHLPLAISQAGAYMRRMSMTVEEYLSLLAQGKTRWEVLKWSDFDRHRRPTVSNSVLETWRISIEQIRAESEISYQILHVIAYVDSQDIPQELIAAAAGRNRIDDEGMQLTDLDVRGAITRLVEFSFLGLRQNEEGGCSYEMHKLVQEAIRYGLRMRGPMETGLGEMVDREGGLEKGEAYYSSVALQIVRDLFPVQEGKPWYMAHAIQVGEWAKVSGTEVDTARLLSQVSGFLYDQGRWREKETVDKRVWDLRREVLGERHPDTISSMASLATTYHEQGRYNEAEQLKDQALNLRREILGEKHPETISSMASLATTYHEQGRYNEAQEVSIRVLDLRRE
ncbi:unnamed protein product, partial [Clonostachys chloroleuca]